jgi:hypothetical protein
MLEKDEGSTPLPQRAHRAFSVELDLAQPYLALFARVGMGCELIRGTRLTKMAPGGRLPRASHREKCRRGHSPYETKRSIRPLEREWLYPAFHVQLIRLPTIRRATGIQSQDHGPTLQRDTGLSLPHVGA